MAMQSRLTLLSQLPTARKLAWPENEMDEMESGGGSATSMSFSPALVLLVFPTADVAPEPKNDMVACENAGQRESCGQACVTE